MSGDYWRSQRVLDAMFGGTSATCMPEQPITADEPSFTVTEEWKVSDGRSG